MFDAAKVLKFLETHKKTGYTSSISGFNGQSAVPQNRLSHIDYY